MNVWLLTGSEQANASVRLGWFGDGLLYERGWGKAVDLDQSRSNVAPEIAWSRCQPSRNAEPMAAMIQINANAPPISSPALSIRTTVRTTKREEERRGGKGGDGMEMTRWH